MVKTVRAVTVSGACASEGDALRDGRPSRKDAVERWLHSEVTPIYDALKANPAQALSTGDVRARLAQAHAAQRVKSYPAVAPQAPC